MIRSATLFLIASLGIAASPAQAGVEGAYQPGYKPTFQPKPSAPTTYRPQGGQPKPASTYRPSFQPAPTRPSFSPPPQAPTRSYTPPAPR